MKNIYHKIYIHPLFYFVAIIFIFTGNFKAFISIMMVILFHELGHLLAALVLKWKINKIIVLPLGCMTEFNEKLNRPIYQEFIILIMGPIFQIILNMIYQTPYHYLLLLINLLPIYPLDGSKLIFLMWNIIGSYYYSYIFTFIVSYITIFVLMICYHNLFVLVFSLYWLLTSIQILKNKDYYFYIFLYERYVRKHSFYRTKVIQGGNVRKMKRGVRHYFFVGGVFVEEQLYLRNWLTFNKM